MYFQLAWADIFDYINADLMSTIYHSRKQIQKQSIGLTILTDPDVFVKEQSMYVCINRVAISSMPSPPPTNTRSETPAGCCIT